MDGHPKMTRPGPRDSTPETTLGAAPSSCKWSSKEWHRLLSNKLAHMEPAPRCLPGGAGSFHNDDHLCMVAARHVRWDADKRCSNESRPISDAALPQDDPLPPTAEGETPASSAERISYRIKGHSESRIGCDTSCHERSNLRKPDDEMPHNLGSDEGVHASLRTKHRRHDLACIDVAGMRGLEIGPLAAPRVRKEEGRISYVDHTDTDGLRNKYSTDPHMQNRLDEIVDIDYVIGEAQGIYEAVTDDAPFDYVIASHLIEHIADVVAWLADVAKVLAVDGILSLIVPDKRYCFDVNRRTTEISEVVDAYLRQLRRPSLKQVYDFLSKGLDGEVDTAAIWAGTADYSGLIRSDVTDPDVAALSFCRTIQDSNEFIDVHCGVFTPDSFLELFEKLARLGLIDFEIAYFAPTEVNSLEFHVSFRLIDCSIGRELMIERQLASLVRFRASEPREASRTSDAAIAPGTMELSHAELRLIATKRRILGWARKGIRSTG